MRLEAAARTASDLQKATSQAMTTGAPPAPPEEPRGARPSKVRWSARIGLLIFAASVPLDMLPIVGETFAITRVTGIILGIAALTQPRLALRRPPRAFWWFAIYVLIVFLGGIPNLDLHAAQIGLRLMTLIQLLAMFMIVTNLMRDEAMSGQALLAFAIACTVVSALMTVGVFQTTIETARGIRLSFAGGNANQVGTTLMLGLLTLVGLGYTARLSGRAWKWLVPVLAMPVAFSIMDTGSRGAVAGLAGGLLVLVFSGEHLGKRLRNLFIFIVVGSAVYFAVYTTFISRVRWEETLEQRTGSGRERIYPALWQMFLERPIQGWGAERNRRELAVRVPKLGETALDAHNLYLHVMTEVGIFGTLPFLVGLALCLQSARRAIKTPNGLLPLVLLCAVLVANLASTWMLRKPLWFVLAYATAAGAGVAGRRRRRYHAYSLPTLDGGAVSTPSASAAPPTHLPA